MKMLSQDSPNPNERERYQPPAMVELGTILALTKGHD